MGKRKPKGMPIIMRGGRPMMINPQHSRLPKDMSEKEIIQAIHNLEFRRMEIQKNNKYKNMRAVQAIDHITEQIQTLYRELELRKENEQSKQG